MPPGQDDEGLTNGFHEIQRDLIIHSTDASIDRLADAVYAANIEADDEDPPVLDRTRKEFFRYFSTRCERIPY